MHQEDNEIIFDIQKTFGPKNSQVHYNDERDYYDHEGIPNWFWEIISKAEKIKKK
jgi:hypothetical protein